MLFHFIYLAAYAINGLQVPNPVSIFFAFQHLHHNGMKSGLIHSLPKKKDCKVNNYPILVRKPPEGYLINSADPDEMLQNMASHQGL